MKISIASVSAAISAIVGILTIGGMILEARDKILDEVREVRSEIAKTRFALVTEMQWVSDDLEYEIKVIKDKGNLVPRYLVERKRRINELLEDLKDNEKDTD